MIIKARDIAYVSQMIVWYFFHLIMNLFITLYCIWIICHLKENADWDRMSHVHRSLAWKQRNQWHFLRWRVTLEAGQIYRQHISPLWWQTWVWKINSACAWNKDLLMWPLNVGNLVQMEWHKSAGLILPDISIPSSSLPGE